MHTMLMKDGRVETPLSEVEIVDLIREYAGDDIGDYVESAFKEADEHNQYEEMKFNSDFTAIESENEGYHNIIDEASDMVEEVLTMIDESKRLDREKLREKLSHLDRLLIEVL